MNSLFDPLEIRGLKFLNRAWVSPMCQYSSIEGVIGRWHDQHLGSLIAGKPGLVMVEATGISPDARISTGCTGIWNEDQVLKFSEIVDFSHSQEVPIGIQLVHSGRKGSTMPPWSHYVNAKESDGNWQTFAPSPIPLNGFPIPRELNIAEIRSVIGDFGRASSRAVAAGFDVIQLHGAYGYLIHQFLSPVSNKRKDDYGGDFENRIRFICEVVKEIRGQIPGEMPLFVRIPAQDWVDGGWGLAESVELTIILKELRVDLVDIVSGGIVENAWGESFEGFQVPFSQQIKNASGLMTAVGGSIKDPHFANNVIKSGAADAVMIGAEFLKNPHWGLMAAETLKQLVNWPVQYSRAKQ